MDLLKTVTGKIVGGIALLVVVIAAISWWRMDEATKDLFIGGTARIVAWLLVVAVWPWVTFGVIKRVDRMDSNAAGAVLVGAYTALQAALLLYLFRGQPFGPTAWTFFGAAVLIAAVYNLLACDWIAERL